MICFKGVINQEFILIVSFRISGFLFNLIDLTSVFPFFHAENPVLNTSVNSHLHCLTVHS